MAKCHSKWPSVVSWQNSRWPRCHESKVKFSPNLTPQITIWNITLNVRFSFGPNWAWLLLRLFHLKFRRGDKRQYFSFHQGILWADLSQTCSLGKIGLWRGSQNHILARQLDPVNPIWDWESKIKFPAKKLHIVSAYKYRSLDLTL